jgi:hypothetical protein
VNGSVADDSAARDIFRASLELRLQQHNSRSARGKAPRHRWKHPGERDKREIGNEEVDRWEGRQVSRIRSFEKSHARVFAQPLMELRTANIDCEDGGCAVLKEAIGESARGGAKVETAKSGDGDAKMSEGGFELESAAADIAFGRGEMDVRLGIEQLGGFDEGEGTHPRPPGHDEALSSFARFSEATLDEEDIGAESWHDSIVAQVRRGAVRRTR